MKMFVLVTCLRVEWVPTNGGLLDEDLLNGVLLDGTY